MPKFRKKRKQEHIKYSLELEEKNKRSVFKDITLIHNCIPEINLKEIDISTSLGDLKLKSPIIINAITGGYFGAKEINKQLAKIARELEIPMAVGSQKIALNGEAEDSFKIVREENPNGIIFANIGADVDISDAVRAVEMLKADALQLHLNIPQEIVMREGRKNFKGILENIKEITHNIKVPVIVKEVGFGIAREQARALIDSGVKIIDVGGFGGTNFIAIENRRRRFNRFKSLEDWGIPTPISLIEVINEANGEADIISSGGLSSGLDVAKSLALGAKAGAFAGLFLYILINKGPLALKNFIKKIKIELKYSMAMTGAKNLEELRQKPILIEGRTYFWMKSRGINLR